MIARKHRFHGHGSLKYVYQHGRTVRGPITTLRFSPNGRRREYRLAVVVSKKVHKSAVTRNRIRRRIYEAFRRQEVALTKPYDMVLTVYHDQVANMPAPDLDKLVVGHLKQAGIIEKKLPRKTG